MEQSRQRSGCRLHHALHLRREAVERLQSRHQIAVTKLVQGFRQRLALSLIPQLNLLQPAFKVALREIDEEQVGRHREDAR